MFRRPRVRRAHVVIVVAILAAAGIGLSLTQALSGPHVAEVRQQIAMPAYINPTVGAGSWQRLTESEPGTVGVAVVNVQNGPDVQREAAWSAVIRSASKKGIKVLGYVNTGYLGTTGETTRDGGSTTDAWRKQIEADVASWYSFYGSHLSGIFFDRTPVACGPTSGSSSWANDYGQLSALVKADHPGATTVLNPGTAVPACYSSAADALVTFEGSGSDYVAPPTSSAQAFRPLTWSPSSTVRIWHLIYDVSAGSDMTRVLALSKTRRASYVFVTDATLPNPYDVLPDRSYWLAEQRSVAPNG